MPFADQHDAGICWHVLISTASMYTDVSNADLIIRLYVTYVIYVTHFTNAAQHDAGICWHVLISTASMYTDFDRADLIFQMLI